MILDPSRLESSTQPTVDNLPAPDTLTLASLSALPADYVLGAEVMAAIFGVGQRALTRMVSRGELPPGVRMAGRLIWTAGVVRQHIQNRAEEASKLADETRALQKRVMPHRKR